MIELFLEEVDFQEKAIDSALLGNDPESLARALHSLKGAVQMAGLRPARRIVEALEQDPQEVRLRLGLQLLKSMGELRSEKDFEDWELQHREKLETLLGETEPSKPKTKKRKRKKKKSESAPRAGEETGLSMLAPIELYRVELSSQGKILTDGFLLLERGEYNRSTLESMLRAAHSLKGAAAVVGLDTGAKIAHSMENLLEATTSGGATITPDHVDILLEGLDLLTELSLLGAVEEQGLWLGERQEQVTRLLDRLDRPHQGESLEPGGRDLDIVPPDLAVKDRILRLDAGRLDALMGLAGEVRVAARWCNPYLESVTRLKRQHRDLGREISGLDGCGKARGAWRRCAQALSERWAELEAYERRLASLAQRLQEEVVACRMRPFSDASEHLGRLVRDLARSLGKEARLVVEGEKTPVDRDILERLEAPLIHLMRNAVDHGLETPQERQEAGKPPEGTVLLHASHRGGSFHLLVRDDGRGVDPELVRARVVDTGLAPADLAGGLELAELAEFLLLPRFTTREQVSEISGRGMGLDLLREMVSASGGRLEMQLRPGQGLCFEILLPLTLSVLPALLVELGGHAYAFPKVRVESVLRVEETSLRTVEGREFVELDGELVGLLSANRVLELPASDLPMETLIPIVVIGSPGCRYGLVVDRLCGEEELVVQTLDPWLGKIQDVAAGAILEDGSAALIFDIDDLLRTLEKSVAWGLGQRRRQQLNDEDGRQSVLVVDDSVTVREIQRKILENKGYKVTVAVDGMDGWNVARASSFDLIVSDIDMPRMDGIRLLEMLRKSPLHEQTPVMIVSYKDREEDRVRGLAAGADHYLTKGAFQDDTFLKAIVKLVGEPNS